MANRYDNHNEIPDTLEIRYLKELLQAGFRRILENQRYIAQTNNLKRSGRLIEMLNSHPTQIQPSGRGIRGKLIYPKHIRFLDMKKKGNYKIYNRQIWGILYRDTFRKMSYMYREWLSGNMKKST